MIGKTFRLGDRILDEDERPEDSILFTIIGVSNHKNIAGNLIYFIQVNLNIGEYTYEVMSDVVLAYKITSNYFVEAEKELVDKRLNMC